MGRGVEVNGNLALFRDPGHKSWSEIRAVFMSVEAEDPRIAVGRWKPSREETESGGDAQPPPTSRKEEVNPSRPGFEATIGKTVRVEGIEFTCTGVMTRKVEGTKRSAIGEESRVESKEEKLVLSCVIRNASEGQVIEPMSKETLAACRLIDNFGNSIEQMHEPVVSMERFAFDGQNLSKLSPGEVMKTIVMADQPPVSKAESFVWTVYLKTNNTERFNWMSPPKEKAIHVVFRAHQIGR